AGMAAETLAHEVHPLLGHAIKRLHSVEKYLRGKKADTEIAQIQAARAYLRMIGKQLSLLNPMLKIYREAKDTIKIEDFLNDYKVFVSRRLSEAGLKLEIKIE